MKLPARLYFAIVVLFINCFSKSNAEENSTNIIDTVKRTLTQLSGDSFNLYSVLASLTSTASLANIYQVLQFAILFAIAAVATSIALIVSEYWTAKEERHEKEHYDYIKAQYAQNPPYVSGSSYGPPQGYYKRQYMNVPNKRLPVINPNNFVSQSNEEYYGGINANPPYNPQNYQANNYNPLNDDKIVGYANPYSSVANLKYENKEKMEGEIAQGNNTGTGIFNSNLYFPSLKKNGNSHSQFFYKTKL